MNMKSVGLSVNAKLQVITLRTHNRPRPFVTDAWPNTEPTAILERNNNN